MPARHTEAHRALELLEEYHAQLTHTRDRQLRVAIEQVISIFKASLFQALLEIQTFYDDTLSNELKSTDQKTYETQQIVARWENNPPMGGGTLASQAQNLRIGQPQPSEQHNDEVPFADAPPRPATLHYDHKQNKHHVQLERFVGVGGPPLETPRFAHSHPHQPRNHSKSPSPRNQNIGRLSASHHNLAAGHHQHFVKRGHKGSKKNGGDQQQLLPEQEEIVLEKGTTGLGFSIAGGSDNPHVLDDPSIYVTKIIPGGAAAIDGRLRKDDIIMRVNQTETRCVPHHVAVDALKRAGNVVVLQVRRQLGDRDSPGLGPPPPLPKPHTTPSGVAEYRQTPPPGSQQPKPQATPPQHHQTYTPPHQQTQPTATHVVHTTPTPNDYYKSPQQPINYQQPEPQGYPQGGAPTPAQQGGTPGGRHTPQGYQQHHAPTETIELYKGERGLGFSIAGGRGNEHVPNDASIYITKIFDGSAAQMCNRLAVGDKLVAVDNVALSNVTHEQAVETLKATASRVVLTVVKNPNPQVTAAMQQVQQEQLAPHGQPNAAPFNYMSPQQQQPAAQQQQRPTTPQDYQPPPQHPQYGQPQHTQGAPQQQQQQPSAGGAHTLPRTTTPQGYQQPPQQHQAANVPRGVRRVNLNKGPQGLGFNIVGGESGEGIFISYLVPGGVADTSGLVHRGDQLLEVNGQPLHHARHEDAAVALKQSGHTVQLVLQYKPQEYERFEARIEQLRNEMMSGATPQPQPQPQAPQQNMAPGAISAPATPGQYVPPPGQYGHQPGAAAPPGPSPRRELYVRALFDYDPSTDRDSPGMGLPFAYGDVLHVTNASDAEWWRARRVDVNHSEESFEGVVPSKYRIERRDRARRKEVKFGTLGAGSLDNRRGSRGQLSFSRKFPFMKSKEALSAEADMAEPYHYQTSSCYTSDSDLCHLAGGTDEPVLSYEAVEQRTLNYPRPVIALGPLKERINDDMVVITDRFSSCVPHTSRPARPNELHGRDYYFVSREQMEFDIRNHQFIEAGQYNGNLYGTSVQSVKDIAAQGKHCILDVSGNAVRRLQAADLFPITVFIKPYDWTQLREWNRQFDDTEAQRQFQRYQRMEAEFAEYFTSIVQGHTPEEIVAKVKQVIAEQSRPNVWVPSRDRLQ